MDECAFSYKDRYNQVDEKFDFVNAGASLIMIKPQTHLSQLAAVFLTKGWCVWKRTWFTTARLRTKSDFGLFPPIIFSHSFGKRRFLCIRVWFWPNPALCSNSCMQRLCLFSFDYADHCHGVEVEVPPHKFESMTNFKLNQNTSHTHSPPPTPY